MDMPVPCSCCGEIVDLNDCHFIDPTDGKYGVCGQCKKDHENGLYDGEKE